jgi:hypothetical protein
VELDSPRSLAGFDGQTCTGCTVDSLGATPFNPPLIMGVTVRNLLNRSAQNDIAPLPLSSPPLLSHSVAHGTFYTLVSSAEIFLCQFVVVDVACDVTFHQFLSSFRSIRQFHQFGDMMM